MGKHMLRTIRYQGLWMELRHGVLWLRMSMAVSLFALGLRFSDASLLCFN